MSKLKFQVASSSGEDDEYPVAELNSHTPRTKGFQTPKFCEYPQEFVIKLDCLQAKITQVQILSHQSKIATKIELFVGEGNSLQQCQFKRLGYLSLSNNEQSDFQARELKSVYIDKVGSFIKFKLHPCYVNKHNLYNQVGIVAINILGEPINPLQLSSDIPLSQSSRFTRSPLLEKGTSSIPKPLNSQGNTMDDLSIDMQFDQVTARRIREVHVAKEKAAEMEDYDQAKQLKLIEEHLKSVGIQLARLDIQKQEAVQVENYDRAKTLKAEIDALRRSIDQKLQQVPMFMSEFRGTQSTNPTNGQQQPTLRHFNSSIVEQLPSLPNEPSYTYPPPGASLMQNDVHHQQNSFAKKSFQPENFDERPIKPSMTTPEHSPIYNGSRNYSTSSPKIRPASSGGLQNGFSSSEPTEYPSKENKNEENLSEPEELTRELLNEIGDMIDIFGEYTMRCFYSTIWNHRDGAIQEINKKLKTYRQDAMKVFRETCKIVNGGICDKVSQVFSSSITLLENLVKYSRDLRKMDVCQAMEPIIVTLIGKLGDGQQRVRDSSIEALLMLSKAEQIGASVVMKHVVKKPQRPSTAWRPIFGRLNVIQQLINIYGVASPEGISYVDVLEYLADGNIFAHSNASVRDAARDITVAIYQTVGNEVDKYLTKLRPKQLEEYQAAFEGAQSNLKKNSPRDREKPFEKGHRGSLTSLHGEMESSRGGSVREEEEEEEEEYYEKKKLSRETPMRSSMDPEDELEESVAEFTCQFCGMYDKSFTEDVLDIHFWSDCLMLTPCGQCEQVIEISGLIEHLLDECQFKDDHRECSRCGEAIRTGFFAAHSARNDCPIRPSLDEGSRCPLCHNDIPMGIAGWKKHLLVEKCPKNPRNTNHIR